MIALPQKRHTAADLLTRIITAQFLPGILDANLCKNKQINN